MECDTVALVHQVPWRVAVCCSVLQWFAVCCSMLQRAVVCCMVVHCVAMISSVVHCGAWCCIVLHCVAMCCNMLQCVAVCCSVLQRVAVCCGVLQCVAVYWSVLQRIAVRWSELQCIHCKIPNMFRPTKKDPFDAHLRGSIANRRCNLGRGSEFTRLQKSPTKTGLFCTSTLRRDLSDCLHGAASQIVIASWRGAPSSRVCKRPLQN